MGYSVGSIYAPKTPTGGSPVCSCGKPTEKKVFYTFEYFFCPACKCEVDARGCKVGDKKDADMSAHRRGSDSTRVRAFKGGPLPPGVVALKGEELTCGACGTKCSELVGDLPSLNFGTRCFDSSFMDIGAITSCPRCYQPDAWLRYSGLLHVEGRGWV